MSAPIRVLLVEDHASFRQALGFMLAQQPDITVVAQTGTVAEARDLLTGVDIGLFDLNLPDGNGLELVRLLRTASPNALGLILTASNGRQDLAGAIEAGAAGMLNKSITITEIIAAVRRVHAGEPLLSPREVIEMLQLAGQYREQHREGRRVLERLTRREFDVLQALSAGLNDREIGAHLRISPETVRTHMGNILGKLGVDSRLQALVFAVRHGAITLE